MFPDGKGDLEMKDRENNHKQQLLYKENPAHKTYTTEAGPPEWSPTKEACPVNISLAERNDLLKNSVSEDGSDLDPVRYAVRRTNGGKLEWFRTLLTLEHADGRIEIHGHPFIPGKPKVPPKVLRFLRDNGTISKAEYRELV